MWQFLFYFIMNGSLYNWILGMIPAPYLKCQFWLKFWNMDISDYYSQLSSQRGLPFKLVELWSFQNSNREIRLRCDRNLVRIIKSWTLKQTERSVRIHVRTRRRRTHTKCIYLPLLQFSYWAYQVSNSMNCVVILWFVQCNSDVWKCQNVNIEVHFLLLDNRRNAKSCQTS